MLKSIKTEKQYEAALERVYNLIQTKLKINSAKAKEADALSILIKKYENIHHLVPRVKKHVTND